MRMQPWWVDRWRKSTAYTDMTLAEQGAYRNLLDECWLRGGTIPDDERILARICGDALEWANVREAVLARFRKVEGGYRNETADELISQHTSYKERQSRAGRARAEQARRDSGRFTSPAETPASQPAKEPAETPARPPASVSVSVSVSDTDQRTNNQSAKPDGFAQAIREVFDYWHRRTERTKATKLDPRRTRMLKARLSEEEGPLEVRVAALKLAVDGAINDPFYAGENERRKRYWELPNIFRNRDRVEELQAAGRRAVAEQETRQEMELPHLGEPDRAALGYWDNAKNHLKDSVPDQNWNTWFRPTFGHHWEGERNITLVVAVPSEQHRTQLREVYRDRIKAIVGDTLVKLVVGRVP